MEDRRAGVLPSHPAPLSSGTVSTYEAGIRVPLPVKWPGDTSPDSVTAKPVTIEDLFPTILEIGGIEFSG